MCFFFFFWLFFIIALTCRRFNILSRHVVALLFCFCKCKQCERDFSKSARDSTARAVSISSMAPTNKSNNAKNIQPANKGRKVKRRRTKYPLKMKTFARQLKMIDKLSLKEIKQKIKERFYVDVPCSTISTWYNTHNLEVAANLPQDRLHGSEYRVNPKQRPDVVVDMEQILIRKVHSMKEKGLPYTRDMIQILAIHIFQKLISFNLYDCKGKRKDQVQPLDDEVIRSAQQVKLATRYLSNSSQKTEFHKSTDAIRNTAGTLTHFCTQCPRKFKCKINMTLHAYWHTIKDISTSDTDDTSDVDDPSQENESDSDSDQGSHRFVASPGWVVNFKERHELGRYKMKGEKGSADYDAVGPWVNEFLTYLITQYVRKDHKTLTQILTIIVNFDETGIQYKSLPQYSYLGKKEEIRAKKPILSRITGLFGSSANGHRFKPLIIGKAARPRAFKNLDMSTLPVYYYNNKSAWMTKDIFRDWFVNKFLKEVKDIIDPDMQIQFLIDNCSSHNDEDLLIMDPKVHIRFLPPNTTSLIQPMDQAILACVKAHQKKCFTINCLDIVRIILSLGHLNYF